MSILHAVASILDGSYIGAAPPVITSPLTGNQLINSPFSYQITATNNPTSFMAGGLAPGLDINQSTGLISGTMGDYQGTHDITIWAINDSGMDSAHLILQVGDVPNIENGTPVVTGGVKDQVMSDFNFAIMGRPTSISAIGLPSGLSISLFYSGFQYAIGGTISGTPTSPVGTYQFSITASNAFGTDVLDGNSFMVA